MYVTMTVWRRDGGWLSSEGEVSQYQDSGQGGQGCDIISVDPVECFQQRKIHIFI